MNSSPRPRRWSVRNVTAVLGPTNTGKTHLAIERLLGHETGVIGLPLRLLAREVYARVAARVGADQVALVTGEEKILPPQPRYWVSTVEAMPRETDAAFVAIDEVQLAADLERGHVFTDRILNLRGSQETLLLGAATMRGIIEQLLPGVHVVTRPRMSVLAYAGQKKLTRLPQRSAVITFSADEVYAVAELIRRQRGGAAVVLGALSPRTRNKQVEIYQSGDVDFIVATDAIGMGLNLDLDHVAFAANRKFDGYQYRELTAAELGQIAGRAGRHMRDGTFGVTGSVDPFPDPLVEAIETHRFEPVRTLQWRNDELDFSSLSALKASLDEPASVEGLTKAPPTDDQVALEALSRDEEVADKARQPDQVKRLWEVCRLPDYRKIAPAQHAQLIGELFGFVADGGVVPDDWIAAQIRQSNHTEGDIDTLSSRIAQIRTWTFVANQPDWLAEPAVWRDETKAVEDALSDALHERLTKRFVDRRTSVLMRRLRENTSLEAEITPTGDVLVEGHHVGVLSGFRFTPDAQAEGADAQALRGAAQKALATAIVDRAERLARAGDGEIVLSYDGYLRWQGEPIARLVAADDVLKPRLVMLADEQLSGPARELAEGRLTAWLEHAHRDAAEAAHRYRPGPARHRHGARHRVPPGGEPRHPRAARGGGGRARSRPGGARGAAPPRRPLRFASHLFPGAAEARAEHASGAALGPQAQRSRRAGPGRAAGDLRIGPHVGRRRPELRSRGLPALRIPRLRPARRPHRHPGAARRPHPPGYRLASRCDGRAAGGRRARGPRLRHHAADDVAARLLRRRFCRHPEGPRLSHGAAAEAEGGAEAASRAAVSGGEQPIALPRRHECTIDGAPQPGEPTPEPPPSEQPPVEEPPAEQPPSEEPPVEEPTIEPPAKEPPPEAAAARGAARAGAGGRRAAHRGARGARRMRRRPSPAGEPEMIEVWRPGFSRHRREDGRPRPPRPARAHGGQQGRDGHDGAQRFGKPRTAASARTRRRASNGSALRRRPDDALPAPTALPAPRGRRRVRSGRASARSIPTTRLQRLRR